MSIVSNADFAHGLRALALYLETHPTAPQLPMPVSTYVGEGPAAKELLQDIARSVPKTIKEHTKSGLFYLGVDFGGTVIVKFYTGRQSVCEKKVVGTRIIPAKHIEAVEAHEEEEREEEIVEWVCEPLLKGEST